MKDAIYKSYGKKGQDIVDMNNAAVDRGVAGLVKVEIPADWADLADEKAAVDAERPDFVRNIADVINAQDGDSLPVSAFVGREDGTFPAGTTAFEKRGIAVHVPEWQPDFCIQCNQCAYVCPHAVIRPFLMDENEVKNAPAGLKTIKAVGKGMENLAFRIQISPMDCTGCGNCADVCPAPKAKAIEMKPLDSQKDEMDRWNWSLKNVTYKTGYAALNTVKGSQFAQPLFEFHGACGGCGETPYIKLITQLYGDRMMIANATGCSSIYGGSAPSTPYCKNAQGCGPSWANSLFEDNAEYGLGMNLGVAQMRDRIEMIMKKAIADGAAGEAKAAMENWLANKNNGETSREASDRVIAALKAEGKDYAKEILGLQQYLVKKSVWIFGGDGWAYDIGFGGLDHVLATGENVNILVLDTEVYSNTGGQSSKSTPTAAVAKFAASGRKSARRIWA
jgi:pyruvate-ferredoxin/flavodoxin oxidoreductase